MTSSELSIVTDDKTAMARRAAVPAQAGVMISTRGQDDAVERAFERAVRDAARLGDLLAALQQGRLWLPLPGDGSPVTDGSAVHLPTVRYLDETFVPAYTSPARLLQASEDLAPGERVSVVPHVVLRAADLARLLPPALGIALNPGLSESVPIYPAGVAQLAAEHATVAGRRVTAGPLPPEVSAGLLAAIRAGLTAAPAAREATAAWLSVGAPGAGTADGGGNGGEGVVISVTLDDPADADARDAVVAAVQQAVTASHAEVRWPVDLTFPGEGEPDVIDRWVAARAAPFYQRSVGLPAPRPASP